MLCTVLMSHLCVCSLPPLIPLRLMQWRAGRITMSIWMRAAPCAPAVRVCLWQQMQQPPATGSVVCEYACVCACVCVCILLHMFFCHCPPLFALSVVGVGCVLFAPTAHSRIG